MPRVEIEEGEKLPHQIMKRLNKKGVIGIFQCEDCGEKGTLEQLDKIPCTHRPEPCKFCGGTPLCEPDCPGVIAILREHGAI